MLKRPAESRPYLFEAASCHNMQKFLQSKMLLLESCWNHAHCPALLQGVTVSSNPAPAKKEAAPKKQAAKPAKK